MKNCPDCNTELVNTGAPIWEDICPNKECDEPTAKANLGRIIKAINASFEKQRLKELKEKYEE